MASLLADVYFANHLLGRLVARELEEAAVSMPEALVLRIVKMNARTTMRELVQATGARNSTMATVVSRLEERRLLQRDLLLGDARHTILRITGPGTVIAGMVSASLDEIEEELARYVTDDDREGITVLAEALATLSGR